MKNPFKIGSTSYLDFETMSDLEWHCSKCELKSGQAKTWQVWRQEKGIQLGTDENGKFFKSIDCEKCKQTTVHRKLKSLDILENTKARYGISPKLARKIKDIYKNEEAVLLRKLSDKKLEIDHKFPQIRWGKDEVTNENLTDRELQDKFILLSKNNNSLKSRYCERCFREGKRGCFPGIYYWYKGSEKWQGNVNDEKGCEGCFWYSPYKWREELKIIIDKHNT